MFQEQQQAEGIQRKRAILTPRGTHILSSSSPSLKMQNLQLKNKACKVSTAVYTQE
jgi:hypothetical protein